jgi:hypothetical protein
MYPGIFLSERSMILQADAWMVLQKLRASSPSLSSKAQGFLLSAKPEFHCELHFE